VFNLSEITKLVKKRKRGGRGGARGKTSGRGNNGQLSRAGGRSEIKETFEGGQMPLCRRLPRRGFHSLKKKRDFAEIVQLKDIMAQFKAGEIIERSSLVSKGILKKTMSLKKIKVLGKEEVSVAYTFKIDAISAGAKLAIEAAGGKVEAFNSVSGKSLS
jgi:large subunit ribosomal protein L15